MARAAAELSEAVPDPETELERQLRKSLVHVQKSGVLVVPTLESKNGLEIGSPAEPDFRDSAGLNATEPIAVHARTVTRNGAQLKPDPEDGNSHSSQPCWVQTLRAQTEALTDIYAASIRYASDHHGNAIKPEDIRALMKTAFINLAQRGRSRG